MNKKHIIYMDFMRVICIFLMVLVHVAATVNHDVPEGSFYWNVLTTIQCAFHFPVPIFLMISGALFLNPEKEINITRLYKKNILRMVTALIFWAGIYAVYQFANLLFVDNMPVKAALRKLYDDEFVYGHYHLWYLYVIIGLYMLVPLIRKITSDKKMSEYFMMLAFVFCMIKNLLPIIPFIGYKIDTVLDKMEMDFVMGYTAYFILGYYLHTYALSKTHKKILYFAGILSFAFAELLTLLVYAQNSQRNEFFYQQLLPTEFIISAAVFVFAKENISKINDDNRIVKCVLRISPYTFGMYLVHDFLIIVCNNLGFTAISFNPIISAPIVAIVVFAGSLLATIIISKIPVLNRYVI